MNLLDAQHIVIFGGTFDPPTVAHVELPEAVRRSLGADLVAYVPAAMSPFKRDTPPTDAEHRVEMLELALKGRDTAKVLTEEIERTVPGKPSYTVDTVAWFRDNLPLDTTLRLLIGADQVATFMQWRDYDQIVEMADPVVMLRPPTTRDALLDSLPEPQRGYWARRLVDVPPIDVSSTLVRQRAAAGESIKRLVPPAVEGYIRKHKLYRDGTEAPA